MGLWPKYNKPSDVSLFFTLFFIGLPGICIVISLFSFACVVDWRQAGHGEVLGDRDQASDALFIAAGNRLPPLAMCLTLCSRG